MVSFGAWLVCLADLGFSENVLGISILPSFRNDYISRYL
jgi:hypothetical protein